MTGIAGELHQFLARLRRLPWIELARSHVQPVAEADVAGVFPVPSAADGTSKVVTFAMGDMPGELRRPAIDAWQAVQ